MTTAPTPAPAPNGNPAPKVPDSPSTKDLEQWGDRSYGPSLSGSGGSKLGQSTLPESLMSVVLGCTRGRRQE